MWLLTAISLGHCWVISTKSQSLKGTGNCFILLRSLYITALLHMSHILLGPAGMYSFQDNVRVQESKPYHAITIQASTCVKFANTHVQNKLCGQIQSVVEVGGEVWNMSTFRRRNFKALD